MLSRRLALICCLVLASACSAETPSAPSVGSSSLPTATAATSIATLTATSAATIQSTPPAVDVPDTTPPGSAAASTAAPAAPVAVAPSGTPVDVVTGLAAPWSIAFVGNVALVSERNSGRILALSGSTTAEVGVIDGVVHQGEGGLLGLAVHVEGQTTYLYTYFTSAADNRIVRLPLTGDPGTYRLGTPEPIISGIPKASNHDGGRLAFGPDGMLYVTVGDAGARQNAQDPNSLSGKILRLTPDGQVPPDNPVAGNPMYSLGHRNPQGLGWDSTGTMWAAEFGQDTWDELNIIKPGANYGWPEVEGIASDDRYVDPVQQWNPDDASPSGIAVVGGTVFIANLKGSVLRAVPTADPGRSTEYYGGEYGRLRDVVVAADGSLWILTNNTDGRGDPNDGDDRVIGVQLSTA